MIRAGMPDSSLPQLSVRPVSFMPCCPIKGDRRFIAGVNFEREALGSGKTSLDFSKEIAADAKTLAFGPDIKLVQGDHMGSRSVTGEGHAANLLAVVGTPETHHQAGQAMPRSQPRNASRR
jgi:hypothetical protein